MDFYVTISHADGSRYIRKVRALHKRTAIIKALTHYDINDVAGVRCPDGIPYTEAERKRQLAKKRRAKERKQKKLEQDIMSYDGLTPIYDETDE